MLGRILAALGAAAALALTSTPADAAVIQDFSGLASPTNGIVLGQDGNLWVAEESSGTVARMSPSGAVLDRFPVGAGPTSLATGPGNRVWVSVTGDHKLVWFDATSPAPSAQAVPMPVACGPVAIVDGGDGNMYFSLPGCPQPRLGSVKADGTGNVTTTTAGGVGQVFDLAVSGGKLFVPDFDNDAIYRVNLGTLTREASLPAPGSPDGITVDGSGTLWVTLYGSGRVGRFAANQDLGSVSELTPTGGTLTGAFGIVAAPDGRIYATGKDSGNLARIDADGSFRFYATNSQPFQVVAGPDGDLYFTDQAGTRVQRFVSSAPRPATITAAPVSDTVGSVTATVDPRGNETQVVFDYGTTSAYGSTSAPITVPAGVGAAPVTAVLSGLAGGTAYHVRVRATNEEGATTGGETTFSTQGSPLPVPPLCSAAARTLKKGCTIMPPTLSARTSFSWAFVGSKTFLRKVDITGLGGGETAKVTCSGKGCPFKSKTFTKLKRGKKALGSRFGTKHRFSKGAKIEVRVTKPGAKGSSALLTIRGRKQDPKIVRSCLWPGATKTSRC